MKSNRLSELKSKMVPVLKKYHVIKAGIFGSVAKGLQHEHSDIDVLVELENSCGLLDFISRKQELEDLLQCKIDLVEHKNIRISMRDAILKDQIPLYGA